MTDISNALADTVQKVESFVLHIEDSAARRSGMVVDGYVVTANHGLDESGEIHITDSDGKSYVGTLKAVDRRLDIAFFETEQSLSQAPEANYGNLRVGNLVLTLGRPGKGIRAALGMISVFAGEHRGPTGMRLSPYIEVDGNLPRGFSGGPLADHDGNVIGMNTSRPRGSGMTVPVPDIRKSIERIGTTGTKSAYLGVNTATAALSNGTSGLVITEVDQKSPAAEAGLLAGDILLTIDGEVMGSQHALYQVLLDGPRNVELSFRRGGEDESLTIALGERDHE